MNKILMILLILPTFLMGCSFSKEPLTKSHTTTTKPILSDKQKDLLVSIRSGNMDLAKLAAIALSPSEHEFIDTSETPLSVALETDQPEMVNLILEQNIDPGNLGPINETTNDKFLNISQKEILNKINVLEANKIKDQMSLSEKVFYDHHLKLLFKELESSQGDTKKILSILKKKSLNCTFVGIQTLTWLQSKDGDGNPEFSIELVKSLPCTLSVNTLSKAYKLELIRQFQNKFKQTGLFDFIFNHSNFANIMWNMDESGIWVSPSFLIDVAYSAENSAKNLASRCRNEGCSSEESDFFKETRSYFKKYGKYDLILTKEGKITHSFTTFATGAYGDWDPFYITTALYMYGKRHYTDPNTDGETDLISWDIYWQTAEEGVHD